jgi:GcrA cell cycle regulator
MRQVKPMNDAGAWTEERVELLKKLWSDGLSASQIAGELGSVTRNAVIGKVHRLGLSGRAKNPAAAGSAARYRSAQGAFARAEPSDGRQWRHDPRRQRARRAQYAPEAESEAQAGAARRRRTWWCPSPSASPSWICSEYMCRWPMGDPTTPEFRFCGGRSLDRPALLQLPLAHRLPAGRRPPARPRECRAR